MGENDEQTNVGRRAGLLSAPMEIGNAITMFTVRTIDAQEPEVIKMQVTTMDE